MLRYQEQNSELTLKEGLEEFYSINPHFKELSEPDGIKGLFFQHDITHIVFGLNSKLEEEHLLDSWALWGCKIKWKTMFKYMQHPVIKEITKKIKVQTETIRSTITLGIQKYAREALTSPCNPTVIGYDLPNSDGFISN